MMVATSLFLIVAMIVSVAFVTLANIYRKIQTNRSVIDNVNFMMDTISFEMREGVDWEFDGKNECISESDNCYTEVLLNRLTTGEAVEYKWNNDPAVLAVEQCLDGLCVNINSSEVKIEKFEIYPVEVSGEVPRATILIYGTAQASNKIKTTFTLQTTVSQRVFTD